MNASRKSIAAVFWGSMALASMASSSHAAPCRPVTGAFASTIEMGPGCASSPISMCTHGRLDGDLHATYEFAFRSLTPDATNPLRSNYEGTSVITLEGGSQPHMFSSDTGFLIVKPDGGASFETTVHIVDGTGDYASASGQIVAGGSLDLGTGSGDGSYRGAICRPAAGGGCGH